MKEINQLSLHVKKVLPGCDIHKQFDELTVSIPSSGVINVLKKLKTNVQLQFNQLIDIAAVDFSEFPQKKFAGCRFAVIYHLLSTTKNHRIRVRAFINDNQFPSIETANEIFPNADWYEREAFDLFGVMFLNHPDLRRILTDYGFIGHPFRKDFPMIGNVEMRYDPAQKRVIYQPVTIEARNNVPRVIDEEGFRNG